MYRELKSSNKKFLCVIPARGGSKGIPNKNLIELGKDISILSNTILQARKSQIFDYIHVSTNSIDIKEEALKNGASCEFLRPEKYANDKVGTRDAINSSISTLESMGKVFDYVFELQPTYVFRKIQTIIEMKELIEKHDSVVTVKKINDTSHPDYICTTNNGLLINGKKLPDQFNRHKLTEQFAVIGIVLASRIETITKGNSIYNSNCGFYVIKNPIEQLDINQEEDLFICREVYKKINS